METKASLVVMSHLSDLQENHSLSECDRDDILNFVKYIILKTGGDLKKEINPQKLWVDFVEFCNTSN